MTKTSAGLLMYRIKDGQPEIFLVHPGGPFFKNKDDGWWSIPKGLPEEGEELLSAAKREFQEETGIKPQGHFIPLGQVKQKGGKIVHAWAFQGEWEEAQGILCNTFEMDWPPRSGKKQAFPEIDRAVWLKTEDALHKINQAQKDFITSLMGNLEIE